jgi:hypothetical protein
VARAGVVCGLLVLRLFKAGEIRLIDIAPVQSGRDPPY